MGRRRKGEGNSFGKVGRIGRNGIGTAKRREVEG